MTRDSFKSGRRRFLGAAAATGIGLGLPFFSSLETTTARAQTRLPTRFVLVSVGHSFQVSSQGGTSAWLPQNGALNGPLPALLSPFERVRDRLCVVGGADNLVHRLVQSNGHNASSRTLLTCMPHAEAIDGSGALRADAPELDHASTAGGPSFEYVLADALGTLPLTLRVGGRNGEHRRTFRLDGSDDQGEPNPLVAFDRLFGAIGAAPPSSARERLALRRADLLRAAESRYRALGSRAGHADRVRFEAHASQLDALVSELGRTQEIVCDMPQLSAEPGLGEFDDPDGRSDDAIARTQNSLIATALSCGATQVASLHYSTMQTNKFPFLNSGADFISAGWHAVVHGDEGDDDARRIPMRWYAEMVGDLVDKLAQVPEGEGTLLDHTVIVFTSSLSTMGHGVDDIPLIVVAPLDGPLRTGMVHRFDNDRRSLADFWTTMLRTMGIPAETFGWDNGADPNQRRPFNRGPMEELFR